MSVVSVVCIVSGEYSECSKCGECNECSECMCVKCIECFETFQHYITILHYYTTLQTVLYAIMCSMTRQANSLLADFLLFLSETKDLSVLHNTAEEEYLEV